MSPWLPPSESNRFQHYRYRSQDSQCALQKRIRVFETVPKLLFGARAWLRPARICGGRDDREERGGLREGWRHMGCCKERMFREEDVELLAV